MKKENQPKLDELFVIPFGKRYFACALADFRDVRKLAVAGVMMALSVALQAFSVPLPGGLKIQFTFLVSVISGIVCGPLLSIIRGAAADIIGFLLFPSGTFFFGYTLSAALGALIYSLFFYRRRVTVAGVIVSKAVINVFVNAVLGSLWNSILVAKQTYGYYLVISLVKNAFLLPFEVAVSVTLIVSLFPAMVRMGFVCAEQGERIRVKLRRRDILITIGLSILIIGAAVALCFLYKDVNQSIKDLLKKQ